MTRSALIVGAVLAGLLLQAGPQPGAAQAKVKPEAAQSTTIRDDVRALFGQLSKQGALYTTDQALRPSTARVDGSDVHKPLLTLGTAPVVA